MTERPEDGERNSIRDRLRRRKVVQWGVAYAAGAWGLLQGLQFLTGTYGWPVQLVRLATLAFALGLPIALVLAWYHGDRGERRVTRTELAILTLIFLLGGGVFWRYQHMSTAPESPGVVQSATTSATPAVATTDRSIAVLPFVNMSADKEQEYFADGISEELLNLLAQVPELRVIARTSSFSFKGKEVDIAEIGRRLNVAYVLEGSVRKSGNRVRITAQLIGTSDSAHLWSQSYDRELTDVFAVQDEIASAVVQQLRITLLSGQPSAPGGAHAGSARTAIDPEAYELYLRGRYEMRSWNKENLARAEAFFERAVQQDPSFGDAWASLAETAVLRHEIHQVRDREAAYARATDAARRALASAPTSAEGSAALSHILWHERRWTLAKEEASRAVALNPSSAMGYEWLGMALTALGRLEEANAAFTQALALDPLSQTYYANAASALVNLGRYGDAESMMQRAVQLGELGFTPFLWWTGLDVLLRVGRIDEAERWVERCAALGPQAELLAQILRARLLFAQGHQRGARDLLADVGSKIPPGAGLEVFVSGASLMIGEIDSGLYWLERTAASADLLAIARFLPEIQQVIAHPRMQALLRENGLEGLPATGPGTPPAK